MDSLLPMHEQARGADSERDVDILRVLGGVQVHAVHRQLLRVLQVVQLRFRWRLASVGLLYKLFMDRKYTGILSFTFFIVNNVGVQCLSIGMICFGNYYVNN